MCIEFLWYFRVIRNLSVLFLCANLYFLIIFLSSRAADISTVLTVYVRAWSSEEREAVQESVEIRYLYRF